MSPISRHLSVMIPAIEIKHFLARLQFERRKAGGMVVLSNACGLDDLCRAQRYARSFIVKHIMRMKKCPHSLHTDPVCILLLQVESLHGVYQAFEGLGPQHGGEPYLTQVFWYSSTSFGRLQIAVSTLDLKPSARNPPRGEKPGRHGGHVACRLTAAVKIWGKQ